MQVCRSDCELVRDQLCHDDFKRVRDSLMDLLTSGLAPDCDLLPQADSTDANMEMSADDNDHHHHHQNSSHNQCQRLDFDKMSKTVAVSIGKIHNSVHHHHLVFGEYDLQMHLMQEMQRVRVHTTRWTGARGQ